MAYVAIYAGHGGSDPGAVAVGLQEKNLNLAVANAATNILRGWGYKVLNNRTTDVDRNITRDAALANDNKVDAVVEIHQNSNPGTPGTGSEAFVSIKDTGLGNRIGSAILQRLAALGFKNRGIKTMVNAEGQDMLGIIRLTNMPAVLLESAFINNPQDMARFDVGRVAMAVAEGIREAIPLNGGGTGGGGGEPTNPSLPAYPGQLIRLGSKGESVRQVQSWLNRVAARQPSIRKLVEDGIFGPLTLEAVRTFQQLFNLTADGIVGPLTWARLAQEGTRECLPPYPGLLLRVGSSGESVRQIQRCLNSISARQPTIGRLTEDGIFGPLTLNAVINFQRIFGLSIDGIVGPATWAQLSKECCVS